MAILVQCTSCGGRFRSANKHQGRHAQCPKCKSVIAIEGAVVPDHDVFVSYSSHDKQAADATVAFLESRRLRCWIAPRDILAGAEWGSSIVNAIEQSRVMVLIYSAHSNQSQQVMREVERAVSKGLSIIPLRIENAALSRNMEYFISASHWLDAISGPTAEHLERLARAIKELISEQPFVQPEDSAPAAVPGPVAQMSVAAASANRPAAAQNSTASDHGRVARRAAAIAVTVLLAGGIAAMSIHFKSRSAASTHPASTTSATSRFTVASTQKNGANASPPASRAAATAVVLLPRQNFHLSGRPDVGRVRRYSISIPDLEPGNWRMDILVGNMGDNSGDMGMHVALADATGNLIFRRFGKSPHVETFSYPVRPGSKWIIILDDHDTKGDGNGGSIEVVLNKVP